MIMRDGLEIEDSLIKELVRCGDEAHEIAKAHHLDPGSNGFTFGGDRYHRATELVTPALQDHDFRVSRKGAGLRAKRDDLELHFGTARGADLTNRAHFDIDSSPARHRAGQANVFVQSAFDGMTGDSSTQIIHVIWSGDVDAGLTAVYVGKLVSSSGQHLQWEDLRRVDSTGAELSLNNLVSEAIPMPTYEEQPEPIFELGLVTDEKVNEN
ncbi:hypothetical protein [Pseudarthrobacter raffinosi]|uniref:hypothetical protein n=1 Tax=Pseudarthrobacter raffinosi TaxID=2953651 RepID=UPI00208EBE15|nr:hypothetical protein [Pseudarthrobacter sp. MDT3-9]MCO4252189.1 hypothetical protein [Pseudarthrobacter sp. MDT3-9]